jgi:hypothetical protein
VPGTSHKTNENCRRQPRLGEADRSVRELADSLEKMGPLAMLLFASMFFMVVALLAAGFGK